MSSVPAQQRRRAVFPAKERHLSGDPLWYKDAVIYELHVKAFFDGNNDGIGDFQGLTQKLDYLEDLGVTALWLLPFYPSPFKDDGYDIADYRGIHPDYGTIADFRVLLREAHRRGMRIITELVVNHTSDQHRWFQQARRARPGSARRNFYVWSETDKTFPETRIIFCDTEKSNWAWDSAAGAYYWHRFYSHQPDLNLNNPRVVEEVIRILRYWLDMGVDGLRLDAVPYLCVREGTNNENLPETHEVIQRIRAAVDRHYPEKILLAEANQWPEDVRPYFGSGDECHMAFHFPLMPRIFIALRQEQRDPIVDIIHRTPGIPETCQWAIFLRNHDELTLEMVTSAERDYMYQEYAADPRMRLNLGIRRRLAPLLGSSLRQMELLNSLLFSFPGSPVIYYGDEIGMGDNIFLGDRNGVRTPMQWSSDRNAGFSRADPARLYLPLIMDAVYGYQAVNVEAQERSSSSFLQFMKRLIALRAQHKAFSRGRIEFLHPANKRVLAYLRQHEHEYILCVANLSRFAQPVELDLSRFEGRIPVELFGRTEFPMIGMLPYFFTMGAHSFYWFLLQKRTSALEVVLAESKTGREPSAIPVEDLEGNFLEISALRHEIEVAIEAYLVRQPWFKGDGRDIISVRLSGTSRLSRRAYLTFVTVSYDDETKETYFLPLRLACGYSGEKLARGVPERVIALLKSAACTGVLLDAAFDPHAGHMLLALITRQLSTGLSDGSTIAGTTTSFYETLVKDKRLTLSQVETRQHQISSTDVIFADRLRLKIFRQVGGGLRPEVEIGRFLTEHRTFDHAAGTAGWLSITFPDMQTATLGVLYQAITGDVDAWSWAVESAHAYLKEVNSAEIRLLRAVWGSARLRSLVEAGEPIPQVGPPVPEEQAHELGSLTAKLHIALVGSHQEPRFVPEWAITEFIDNIGTVISSRAFGLGKTVAHRVYEMPEEYKLATDRLVERFTEIGNIGRTWQQRLLRAAAAKRITRIRCLSNLDLAQLLKRGTTFVISDFEGDHRVPLQEIKRKQPPASDIASMVYSLQAAAHRALKQRLDAGGRAEAPEPGQLLAAAETWALRMSVAFIKAYLTSIQGCKPLEMAAEDFYDLLNFLLLDKELLDLEYQLSGRGREVHIPVTSLLDHITREVPEANAGSA